jgi:hypothetical protein
LAVQAAAPRTPPTVRDHEHVVLDRELARPLKIPARSLEDEIVGDNVVTGSYDAGDNRPLVLVTLVLVILLGGHPDELELDCLDSLRPLPPWRPHSFCRRDLGLDAECLLWLFEENVTARREVIRHDVELGAIGLSLKRLEGSILVEQFDGFRSDRRWPCHPASFV